MAPAIASFPGSAAWLRSLGEVSLGGWCWELCQVFLMVREGTSPRDQAGAVRIPYPSPGCWTLSASRGATTAPSPRLLLPTEQALPISVLL